MIKVYKKAVLLNLLQISFTPTPAIDSCIPIHPAVNMWSM